MPKHPYRCATCGRSFRTPQGLAAHSRKHQREGTPSAPNQRRPSSRQVEAQVAYAHGRVEGFLGAYAEAIGLTYRELAGRVADLLRHPGSG